MAYSDITHARRHCARLKDLILNHPGAIADAASLRRVKQLCLAAEGALEDDFSRYKLASLQDMARDFLSDDRHLGWHRGAMPGADFLRLQMLSTLDSLEQRFCVIEDLRALSMPSDLPLADRRLQRH